MPAPAAARLIAKDGNGFLVSATLEPDLPEDEQDSSLDAAQARLTSWAPRSPQLVPGATGQVGGGTLLFDAITGQVEKDLVEGELIALPVSLLVMVLVFGGFLAAGMPIAGAIASIGGALATLLGFSYLIDLDAAVVNVVTVLGLGLCIDYGLLIVSRYREELRRQLGATTTRSTRAARTDALVATMAHRRPDGDVLRRSPWRSACPGLLLFQARILRAVGAAGVSVVVVALLVALTLVPALLALAGARMIRPGLLSKIPGVRQADRPSSATSPPRRASSPGWPGGPSAGRGWWSAACC